MARLVLQDVACFLFLLLLSVQCWIFEGKFPEGLIFDPENTYYWQKTFDPATMQLVQNDN